MDNDAKVDVEVTDEHRIEDYDRLLLQFAELCQITEDSHNNSVRAIGKLERIKAILLDPDD